MSNRKQPDFGNGKICYLEIPALDVEQSAAFYSNVFGWHIRKDDTGNISFDDGVGQVSGMWTTGRKPATDPGIMISIMVTDMEATISLIEAKGGKILLSPGEQMENVALFADPAGNAWSLYLHAQS